MLSLATIAAIAPLILGIKASVVCPRLFPSLLLPNFPVSAPDPSFPFAQVKEVPRDVTPEEATDSLVTGQPGYVTIDCNQYNDWQCFKDFFERNQYCHPLDTRCYQDCHNYDDYRGRCSEQDYGKCYDKCYYDHYGCDKWKDCHEDDADCYRKKRPDDYCQPWDWECHKKEHHPGYPDYDNDDDGDEYDGHPEPKHDIIVKYYGPEGSYEQRVWPDGDEAWTGMSILLT